MALVTSDGTGSKKDGLVQELNLDLQRRFKCCRDPISPTSLSMPNVLEEFCLFHLITKGQLERGRSAAPSGLMWVEFVDAACGCLGATTTAFGVCFKFAPATSKIGRLGVVCGIRRIEKNFISVPSVH
jgi:hypothetical protein